MEYFSSANMELPQNAVSHLFRNGFVRSFPQILGTGGGKIGTDTLELLSGLNHGTGILAIALEQENKSSQPVQRTTDKKHLLQFLLRKILIEHQKVVAEIQESLARILLL